MNAEAPGDLRVIQVSDCHVSSDPDADYRGTRAGSMLESLLPAVRGFQPDLVLLTGDVSEDFSPESYQRVSGLLSSIDAPLLALPGNHDDPVVMARYFPDGPWRGPLFHSTGRWQCVMLDSTRPGEICGKFSEDHLEALERGLDASDAEHILLALHHQPVEVGSPCFDRYPLRDPEKLLVFWKTNPACAA